MFSESVGGKHNVKLIEQFQREAKKLGRNGNSIEELKMYVKGEKTAELERQQKLDNVKKLIAEGEEEVWREAYDDLLSDAVAHVGADWKDVEGLIDDFILAVEKLGGIVVEDPLTEGSDMFGFLVFKK